MIKTIIAFIPLTILVIFLLVFLARKYKDRLKKISVPGWIALLATLGAATWLYFNKGPFWGLGLVCLLPALYLLVTGKGGRSIGWYYTITVALALSALLFSSKGKQMEKKVRAAQLAAATEDYNYDEVAALQKAANKSLRQWKARFQPLTYGQWFSQEVTIENWGLNRGILGFSIPMENGETLRVEVSNNLQAGVATGSWLYLSPTGQRKAGGAASMGTRVPAPSVGPEVHITLENLPTKRVGTPTVTGILKPEHGLKEYLAKWAP